MVLSWATLRGGGKDVSVLGYPQRRRGGEFCLGLPSEKGDGSVLGYPQTEVCNTDRSEIPSLSASPPHLRLGGPSLLEASALKFMKFNLMIALCSTLFAYLVLFSVESFYCEHLPEKQSWGSTSDLMKACMHVSR